MTDTQAPPRISVILPVYNGEAYLSEAIESILNQTFRDFEAIIIDDGSKDGSLAILEEIAARDPRVRVVSRENRGLVATLNQGIELARAPLIARMDADDISLPERFEKQVAYMDAHPECVALGTFVTFVDPRGRPLSDTWFQQSTHEEIDGSHIRAERCQLCHPSTMIRTEAIRSVGGYRDAFVSAEDFDLWLRLGELGNLENLPEILLYYRQHPLQVTVVNHKEGIASSNRAIAEACQRRGIPEVSMDPPKAQSIGQTYVRWAWWALEAGYVASARRYAVLAWRNAPLNLDSYRLLYCALRGH